jgi:DNA-binding transcriptional regulator YdaS (Cro superfamily)
MQLNEYLKTTTQGDLAKALGVSQGLVSQWLSGATSVTAERAVQIEQITGGKVKRQELRPDLYM